MTAILIRADAFPAIGTGHLVRCLALAHALKQRGSTVHIVTTPDIPDLIERARAIADSVTVFERNGDATNTTLATARNVDASWAVLDGYHFTLPIQRALHRTGLNVFCIDDWAGQTFECDVLLNQNLHAVHGPAYRVPGHTRVLLGPQFALLRPEFVNVTPPLRDFLGPGRVLITTGGSDPDNAAGTALDALHHLPTLPAVRVIVGADAPYADALRSRETEFAGALKVHQGVREMVPHMQWCDRCITAGGSTCWEYCRLGVPMAVGIIATNQEAIAESIERHGVGRNLGWLPGADAADVARELRQWWGDPDSLARASDKASTVVDGKGAGRVADVLLASSTGTAPSPTYRGAPHDDQH